MLRITIFVHYDRDNIIDKHVIRYIKALTQVSQTIYFVSNCSNLAKIELEKIQPYTKNIFQRDNRGGDFAAWKTVLLQLYADSRLEDFDELILANDSCYLASSSLTPMFDDMSGKNSDMWGITENICPTHHYEGKVINISPHIQSYFLVFRKKILKSSVFKQFWQKVDLNYSRDQTIIHYEVGLTQLLREHDFTCCSYMRAESKDIAIMHTKYFPACYDLSLFYGVELLKKHNPLLKVKAIPSTLEYSSACLKQLQKHLNKNNLSEIFLDIHQHLQRVSSAYQAYRLPLFKKVLLLIYRMMRRLL